MINGSLWTIFHEVVCYVLVAVLAAVGALRAWSIGLLALLLAAAEIASGAHSEEVSNFLLVAPGLFAGVALCLVGIQKMRSPLVMLATAGSLLVMIFAWRRETLSNSTTMPFFTSRPIVTSPSSGVNLIAFER